MPDESAHKPALLEIAAALRELHRSLLGVVREEYEREVGPVGGPGHLLGLATEHPFFAWLHPMSELIVDLDTLLDQELLPQGTVAAVRLEVDRVSQASDLPFWGKYAPLLQTAPEVVMSHARLRQAMKSLPPAVKNEPLHERRSWQTPRVHARRGLRS